MKHSPSFQSTMQALKMSDLQPGLYPLDDHFSVWNCEKAKDSHQIPEGYTVLSARQLVQARIDIIFSLPQRVGISMKPTKSASLSDLVERHRGLLMPMIPPICLRRLKTRTLWLRNEQGDWELVDVSQDWFRKPEMDYDSISDGGARITGPVIGESYARLSWEKYLQNKGGNIPLEQWERHTIVRALIPEGRQRKQYLTAVGLLKLIRGDSPRDSLWVPSEMSVGHARWVCMGRDEVGLYPANNTTTEHSVILKKEQESL